MHIRNLIVVLVIILAPWKMTGAEEILFGGHRICDPDSIFDKANFKRLKKSDYDAEADREAGFDEIEWRSTIDFYISRQSEEIIDLTNLYAINLNFTPVVYGLTDQNEKVSARYEEFITSILEDVVNQTGRFRYFSKSVDHHGNVIYKSPHNQASWYIFAHSKLNTANLLNSWRGTCSYMHQAGSATCRYQSRFRNKYSLTIDYAGQLYAQALYLTDLFDTQIAQHFKPIHDSSSCE